MKRFLTVMLGAALITNEGTGEGSGEGGGAGEGSVDLASLFSPEEITAKQESLTQAKAEEERRASLTEEQRAEEDRVKAEEAAKNHAPESYADFQLPEGVEMDKDLLAEFTPLAKELNLPQDKAQQIIDLGAKMAQKAIDGIMSAHTERMAGWLKSAESDPEIGADVKLGDQSASVRAFNSIASDSAKQMVNELGIGNHPEFIRLFFHLSQKMREDSFVVGNGGREADASSTLYPTMKK